MRGDNVHIGIIGNWLGQGQFFGASPYAGSRLGLGGSGGRFPGRAGASPKDSVVLFPQGRLPWPSWMSRLSCGYEHAQKPLVERPRNRSGPRPAHQICRGREPSCKIRQSFLRSSRKRPRAARSDPLHRFRPPVVEIQPSRPSVGMEPGRAHL